MFRPPPCCLFTDGNFAVLGGQHLTSALKQAKEQLEAEEKTIPPSLLTARARVLSHETTLQERQEEVWFLSVTEFICCAFFFGGGGGARARGGFIGGIIILLFRVFSFLRPATTTVSRALFAQPS